jgi:2-C-methyl-D-erythritol 4-phosphate cytidylyltransferase
MAFLNANYSILPTDIIITHDAARINVNSRIINDNICVAKKHGYASTVLPLADSLCQLNKTISYVSRDNKFLVQTPQTFQYKYWSSHIDNPRVTDLFTYLKLTLLTKHLVMGSNMNFKITNQNDLIFE